MVSLILLEIIFFTPDKAKTALDALFFNQVKMTIPVKICV